MALKRIFPNKSRSRRLQYEWLQKQAKAFPHHNGEKVLDLGGVYGAEYHALMGFKNDDVLVWNFDPSTGPSAIVDLEKIDELPAFPSKVKTVFAMNLLEHLFRPFDLMEWVCKSLPEGGRFVVVVPFAYPIHPSPNDYWRIAPQAFERFFAELAKREGVQGRLVVEPLGVDFREGTSLLTSEMFKSTRAQRLIATMLETAAHAASGLSGAVMGRGKLKAWAERNAPAIGVVWTKE